MLTKFIARENARIKVEAAARDVNAAILRLRNEAPSVLVALETAGKKTTAYGVKSGTLLIVKSVVGSSSYAALNGVLAVTKSVSVIFTVIDIAKLLVIDVKLVTLNVQANWAILTKLKPAAEAFETADAAYVAALSGQPWIDARSTLSYQLTGSTTNPGSITGVCKPNFSGAATVQVRAVVGLSLEVVQWSQQATCTNGRYSIAIANAAGMRVGYSAFFLAIRSGASDTFITPLYVN